MEERRWKHSVKVVRSRGRVRFECICGWQTGWYATTEEEKAKKEVSKHTGLVERERRPDGK